MITRVIPDEPTGEEGKREDRGGGKEGGANLECWMAASRRSLVLFCFGGGAGDDTAARRRRRLDTLDSTSTLSTPHTHSHMIPVPRAQPTVTLAATLTESPRFSPRRTKPSVSLQSSNPLTNRRGLPQALLRHDPNPAASSSTKPTGNKPVLHKAAVLKYRHRCRQQQQQQPLRQLQQAWAGHLSITNPGGRQAGQS